MMLAPSQIAALAIFVGVFISLITGRVHRYIPALIGAALTLLVVFLGIERDPQAAIGALDVAEIGKRIFWIGHYQPGVPFGVNWQTILFIGGMMILVEGLRAVRFFRWICLNIAQIVNYSVIPIALLFMVLSGVLSMFLDNVTVILFMGAVTIELARLLKINPIPLIIAEIVASNAGGTATLIGDPPNIIIGTSLGLGFNAFLVNLAPIVWIGMAATLGYFYLRFRKERLTAGSQTSISTAQYPKPGEVITNRDLFRIQVAILVAVVVLLVTHEQARLSVVSVSFIGAGATLLASRRGASSLVKGVDWRTLLFFFGLFVAASGLEQTGLLQLLADYIGAVSGNSLVVATILVFWVSAFISAIVDNIPFVTIMVPVIVYLSQATGGALSTLAWSLSLGACIGGNATPIGASANVVGIAVAEKTGYRITWKKYLNYAVPPTLIILVICNLMLMVRYLGGF
jgi:Na+/H+ antiporter NhaD/arsenite permease-like protein